MPVVPKHPGVHIDEEPSQSHVITGVPTANTAFVDVFERGPDNRPTKITNPGEFAATFGATMRQSRASYGISQFFLHGGSVAWVVRVPGDKAKTATGKCDPLGKVTAIGSGKWGNNIQVAAEQSGSAYNFVVRELIPGEGGTPDSVAGTEIYRDLSSNPNDPNYWATIVGRQSSLIAIDPDQAPPETSSPAPATGSKDSITSTANASDPKNAKFENLDGGDDDYTVSSATLGHPGDPGAAEPVQATGLFTLDSIAPEMFNLLCIPAMANFGPDDWSEAFGIANGYCVSKRAFFIADPPTAVLNGHESKQVQSITDWFEGKSGEAVSNATTQGAVYFPRLVIADPNPAAKGAATETEASGTMAGLYAATDAARGVWKAPAGTTAVIQAIGPKVAVPEADNGALNELGINVLRKFPVYGTVCWGARTIDGADLVDSQFKYINVRRLTNYIELSLQQSTQWAVFERNDETLWSALRLSIGAFMDGLYRQGAFSSSGKASDSYFVQCDATTTTAVDRAQGRVNVLVGFAPLYPAEFVVITISQMTGQ